MNAMSTDEASYARLSQHRGEPCEQSTYFDDGVRRVDCMLAYQTDHLGSDSSRHKEILVCRDTFFKSLSNCKLQFEEAHTGGRKKGGYGSIKDNEEKEAKVHFIKVHAPIEILYDSAEDVKMKMPTRANDVEISEWYKDNACFRFINKIDPFKLRNPQTQETKNDFVATFDKSRLSEFINYDKPDVFFTPAERGRLVYYILQKASFGANATDIGIGNLVHKGVFLDAFPLHDGPSTLKSGEAPTNGRQRLRSDWANFSCIFKYQPMDAIREYFGEKIALYFAWLGFYTMFLIPAALVGIVCFIVGVLTTLGSPLIAEICSDDRMGPNGTLHKFYMCPLCDIRCPYYLLQETCLYAKVTHFFDNEAMLAFAAFMSVWSTVFLEFWKRRQFSLAYEWHSLGFEDAEEYIRPEYAAANPTLRKNKVTGMLEPYMRKSRRVLRLAGAVSTVLFFIILVLIFIMGVIVFRAAVAIALYSSSYTEVQQRSKIITSAIGGLVNLVVINILKFVYQRVAVKLTDWENPRTRTDYEDSFTVKMFFFQFVNTYSSIIYIAFFKTEAIIGSPGQYNRMFKSNFRVDNCSVQGCFLELTVQLVIIMVGQQLFSNFIEIAIPTFMKWYKDRKASKEVGAAVAEQPQWVDDYEGQMQDKFSLFWEYLEIVLQYGFVTMFVAGFPLAPLFAFINNILEIRVDAYNYVNNCRRPVAQRAEDIGAWFGILATLTSISILVNAFVIAFTSELIPRLVYLYTRVQNNGTMAGYTDWSLATFNVKDYSDNSRPGNKTIQTLPPQLQCRYPGFHQSSLPYDYSLDYWRVLSARLAFVVCFVLLVLCITWAIGYIIPDVPQSLELKMKREKFLASEADKNHKEKTGKRKPRPAHEKNDDANCEENEAAVTSSEKSLPSDIVV